jgi:hypothetical protein
MASSGSRVSIYSPVKHAWTSSVIRAARVEGGEVNVGGLVVAVVVFGIVVYSVWVVVEMNVPYWSSI